ncbi:tRNA-dihydrouridine synthase family protein [Halosquirtibacter xylanolyticus]|uniref:tRNA-dihydrouridine synthase family protein n=1 Tax=Halosquirtibacter xylanolyticus TaxID=3374599 RepID=UPI0037498ACD|nr:tRNA-dihydrouridine synthase family protein [Prolixibacteraceae bacterium]
MDLYLAPLQEFTEYSYRNAIQKHIGGFEKYFIPYISFQRDLKLKNRQKRDIAIENNPHQNIVPQILAANREEVEYLLPFLDQYNEVNINFGCPYPMATKKRRGAGIYHDINMAKEIIESTISIFKGKVSVKLRSGLETHETWKEMIDILNQYQLEEIIIHPRTASQLYKGTVELSYMKELIEKSKHPVIYNGDITTIEEFDRINEMVGIKGVMLGRGALQDIFLASKIKGKEILMPKKILESIHQDVFECISKQTDIEKQVVQKMERFWSYFSYHFVDSRKVYKKFKKSKNMLNYNEAISHAFSKMIIG